MCTSIAMNNGGFCFGRNMDIEFELPAAVAVMPRRYPLSLHSGGAINQHYALIGAAVVRDGFPLYCDAMNEAGLCMAGLSFPDSVYLRAASDKTQIAPFEMIPFVLSQCADISQAAALLSNTAVIDKPFSADMPNTPLHWHIADSSGALVVECTDEGTKIHSDPIGVLTNAPSFDFHLQNLRQYTALSADYPADRYLGEYRLSPFGRGFGAIGLPGDFSPASRFVRAAFVKHNSVCGENEESRISQLFHVLRSVEMPRGSVLTADGREELTAYSCCMSGGVYYYTTYSNSRVCAADMRHAPLDSETLTVIPFAGDEDILWQI